MTENRPVFAKEKKKHMLSEQHPFGTEHAAYLLEKKSGHLPLW